MHGKQLAVCAIVTAYVAGCASVPAQRASADGPPKPEAHSNTARQHWYNSDKAWTYIAAGAGAAAIVARMAFDGGQSGCEGPCGTSRGCSSFAQSGLCNSSTIVAHRGISFRVYRELH